MDLENTSVCRKNEKKIGFYFKRKYRIQQKSERVFDL